MHLFLSYSSADYDIAAPIQQALVHLGHTVWFAPQRIGAGQCFAAEISDAMKSAEALLLLASEHSVGNATRPGSNEVKTEIKMAREKGIAVIPLKVDASLDSGGATGFDYLLKNFQWVDIEAMLLSRRFDVIAQRIDGEIQGGLKPDFSGFSAQLEEVETLLKAKRCNDARQVLNALRLPAEFNDELALLKIIAFLQGQTSIRRLSKRDADACVQRLADISQGAVAAPALYLQAILSENFYLANSIADGTAGFMALKLQAQPHGRLKAKYIKMTDGFPADGMGFVSRWR
ncbi:MULTISPECIES: toll/interleukin-1 receptor domain-containing protein [Ferrimonas]|uniref:toll/interleukin-1 receptor domain-containing protein n=1 Tax=Ferrimonas TaxID=44011 RepID=UPI000411B2D4|nr:MULTISPECIES: toll/interleukin-1 receptor domain-containing protein [Ferrimonas]USD39474.1 toll/interleukin-1 receptor domain-containing protein [Ferrimonas sp. SCSIO 43195]